MRSGDNPSVDGSNESLQTGSQALRFCGFALPHNGYAPARTAKVFLAKQISSDIFIELSQPKPQPRFWSVSKLTVLVPVPEAPMHENHLLPSRQNNIRSAGQAGYVNTESVTH